MKKKNVEPSDPKVTDVWPLASSIILEVMSVGNNENDVVRIFSVLYVTFQNVVESTRIIKITALLFTECLKIVVTFFVIKINKATFFYKKRTLMMFIGT
jgi:hypothetical protein